MVSHERFATGNLSIFRFCIGNAHNHYRSIERIDLGTLKKNYHKNFFIFQLGFAKKDKFVHWEFNIEGGLEESDISHFEVVSFKKIFVYFFLKMQVSLEVEDDEVTCKVKHEQRICDIYSFCEDFRAGLFRVLLNFYDSK